MIDLLKRALDVEVTVEGLAEALSLHSSGESSEDLGRLAGVLADVVHRVPDALTWALALSKDERCGRAVAFATGSIFNYLFDPDDLLPESHFGHLGLLDDAYLVHVFVARLAQTYPFAQPRVAYAAPNPRSLDVVASFLPDGIAQSLVRTCETTVLVAQALFVAGSADGMSAPLTRPDIRVTQAIGAARGVVDAPTTSAHTTRETSMDAVDK